MAQDCAESQQCAPVKNHNIEKSNGEWIVEPEVRIL